jgi:alkylation response protein AidB-like acyl-CoA dehydrogenase
MDLELSDDQRLFQDTTVRFIESELPMSSVRALHEDPTGYDRQWLQRSADLGWFAMMVPEDNGGGSISGAGLLDATIVAEELGRHMQPGPFIPMNVVALAIAESGSEAQRSAVLPQIVSAEQVATWAVHDEHGNWDAGAGVTAAPMGAGWSLRGTRGCVEDAQSADLLLVVAQVDGRPAQFLVPTASTNLTITALNTLDLSRRFADVVLDGVAVPSSALVGAVGAERSLQRQLDVALVLLCAETVGVIDWMFSHTVQYAKDRTAFGRPIGSFQSLKHIMADLGMYVEMAKAGALAAARAVQNSGDDASEVAAMAASFVGDVAVMVSQEALQIHGGIGYTWEHDLHLYLRRARSNSLMFGEPGWHRERVVTLLGH